MDFRASSWEEKPHTDVAPAGRKEPLYVPTVCNFPLQYGLRISGLYLARVCPLAFFFCSHDERCIASSCSSASKQKLEQPSHCVHVEPVRFFALLSSSSRLSSS